jgi:diguanylate cyclase (GGDEF)-like protein
LRISIRMLFPFIIQILILILCEIIINKVGTLSQAILFLIKNSSYIIFGISIILSIWFNRSRIFFTIIFLAASELLIINYSMFSISENTFHKLLYPLLGMLLPVNILIFSQLEERGIFSLWGKLRSVFIIIELFFIFQIVSSKDKSMLSFVNYKPTMLSFYKGSDNIMVLTAFFVVLICIIIKIIIKGNAYDKRIIGIIIFTYLALTSVKNEMEFFIFLAGAGLILIIGIIEDSYLMSYMDELTGIPARRGLRELLMKLGNKYVIAMIDIDLFKKFNDTYGHDVGDEVLKLVAANLVNSNGGGKAFRYGGEEFTIVFPGKTISEVIPRLEKLREQISKTGYTRKSVKNAKTNKRVTKQIYVTISMGVSEKNAEYKSSNEVMKAADKALYRAKKKGRNCVSK